MYKFSDCLVERQVSNYVHELHCVFRIKHTGALHNAKSCKPFLYACMKGAQRLAYLLQIHHSVTSMKFDMPSWSFTVNVSSCASFMTSNSSESDLIEPETRELLLLWSEGVQKLASLAAEQVLCCDSGSVASVDLYCGKEVEFCPFLLSRKREMSMIYP
jgi:hypothetical protein